MESGQPGRELPPPPPSTPLSPVSPVSSSVKVTPPQQKPKRTTTFPEIAGLSSFRHQRSVKKQETKITKQQKKAQQVQAHSAIVQDHRQLQERGFCADCYTILEEHLCDHMIEREVHMCERHRNLPLGVSGLNYQPQVSKVTNDCTSCVEYKNLKILLTEFRRLRGLPEQIFEFENNGEKKCLSDMYRARIMSQEAWDAEREFRESVNDEKARIRSLSGKEAKQEEKTLLDRIQGLVPQVCEALAITGRHH